MATALLLVGTSGLRASGWPSAVRAILVIPIALFWASALAAVAEHLIRPGHELDPWWLAGAGATALLVAELLVLTQV